MACPLCTACARCSAVDLPCHPAPTERAPAPVRHLHVPKTGTSFAYTLVAHRCGGVLPPEQLFAWPRSICLYHAAARSARPLEMEFANANPAHGAVGGATHDEALLEGFVDHADEAVYAAARELFEAHERRVRGGLATNLLSRAFDGNVGLKKPRRVIK